MTKIQIKVTDRNKPKNSANNYVDNEKFYNALVEYKAKAEDCISRGLDAPKVSNYIGSCFMQIADNLGHLKKFRNYTYLDEMKSDAVYVSLKYILTFNPERTNKPFAYFTKAAYFAFLQRINSEKRNLYKKYKAMQNSEIFGLLSDTQNNDNKDYSSDIGYNDYSRETMELFIAKFEKTIKDKKNKANAVQSTDTSTDTVL